MAIKQESESLHGREFPREYWWPEKYNPDYRWGIFKGRSEYLSVQDRTGHERIEYFLGDFGMPIAYRQRLPDQSTIMPVGDLRRYFRFEKGSAVYHPLVWASNRLKTASNVFEKIEPDTENQNRIGVFAYTHAGRLCEVGYGHSFLEGKIGSIGQLKGEPYVVLITSKGQLSDMTLSLERVRGGSQRVVECQGPRWRFTYPIFDNDQLFSQVSGEVVGVEFIGRQSFFPDKPYHITKILRAPLQIDRPQAEYEAFTDTPEDPTEALWPNIDTLVRTQISFSGPGFPIFMGEKTL